MKIRNKKTRIGILGCGAIGSGIATSIGKELNDKCVLTALFDIVDSKSRLLAKRIFKENVAKNSLKDLLASCDFVVEAISSKKTKEVIRQILRAKKNILVMSVGKLLNATEVFNLAKKNRCSIVIPSGAVGGLDVIKAARLAGISKITLTTRKPISGFSQSSYLTKKGIKLNKIKSETVLFNGGVTAAVRLFPKNINVAATLAIYSKFPNVIVEIVADPKSDKNTHEITVEGSFGRIKTKTENVPSPNNPRTSYLAVLSAISTLKELVK